MSPDEAKGAVNSAIAGGMAVLDPMLQGLYDSGSTDVDLITALSNLRTQYTLDQMRINRAQIDVIDNDPAVQATLAQLDTACTDLTAIQNASKSDTAWVKQVTSALDTVMGAYSGIAKFVAAI